MAILVVEDDRALCVLVETLLRRRGAAVEVAMRGDAALHAIESRPFDAIVLDLMLPVANGFEILDHLAATRPKLLSRIIILTAVSSAALRDFRFQDRIWQLIRKPFDVDQFTDVVLACALVHASRGEERPDDFAQWFGRRSAELGARAGVVTLAGGDALHLRAAFGFGAGLAESEFPLPLDGNFPLCSEVRLNRPVWLASLTLARAQYPLLLSIWTANGSQAIAALPLSRAGAVVGAIGWSFDRPHAFDEPSRSEFLLAASECAELVGTSQQRRASAH